MMSWRLAVVFAAALAMLGMASPALAQEGSIFVGGGTTESKPQSKVWYHDGTWWAVLLDGSDHYIWRLDGDDFTKLEDGFVDEVNTSYADALWTGQYLYILMGNSSDSRLYKFSYNTTTRSYAKLTGFPVSLPLGDGFESVGVAQDSTGKLWVTTIDGGRCKVIWSTSSDHRSWNTSGVTLDSSVDRDDISAITAFAGKIGVFWSDQSSDTFGFAYHVDGQSETQWTSEIVAGGGGIADDHINLATTPSGHVLAATKDGHEAINLFVRGPSGGWEGPHTVAEPGTRGIVVYDSGRDRVFVLYTNTGLSSYRIEYKDIAFSDVADFELAPREVLLSGGFNNVTTTKQMVDHTTALLAFALRTSGGYAEYNTVDLSGGLGFPAVSVAASAAEGIAPLTVNFVSTATDSNGTIVSYAWTFGDGGTASTPDATHTFTTPGYYEVRLVATDNDGNTGEATVGVLVRSADEPVPGSVIAQVNFQPSGRPIPTGYLADYGEPYSEARGYGWAGGVPTQEREGIADQRLDTYAYVSNDEGVANWEYRLDPGDYFVTVVAGDPIWSGVHTVAVEGTTVINAQPTTADFVEVIDHPVSLSDGRLTIALGGTGDKKSKLCYVVIRAGEAPPPNPDPGPAPSAPTASASATPTTGVAPLAVNFTGGGTDSDGTIASYHWDFADGLDSNVQSPSHTFTDAGTYVVVLTVTDDSGLTAQDSVTIVVTASGPAPVAPKATATASVTSGTVPLTVDFTGAGSDSDGTIVSYSWDFGDGTGSTLQNPSHTYNAVGTFTATLTVTDNSGLTGQDSVAIEVTAVGSSAPTATATASATDGTAPLAVNFTGAGSDTDGTISSYSWDFGDGTGSTLQNPSHTYSSAGTFVAVLTVTDNSGLTGQDSVTITVSDPAPPPSNEFPAYINFQPPGHTPPAGYVADEGDGFDSSRGFGWTTVTGYDAKDATGDVLLDTYAYVPNEYTSVWEYALPNGDYLVTIVAGDPVNRSLSTVKLEGALVLDAEATDASFVEATDYRVTVSDGRLTMTMGGTGADRKTKVCYMIISRAP